MRKRLKLMHHTMRIAVRLDDALLSPRVDDEARQGIGRALHLEPALLTLHDAEAAACGVLRTDGRRKEMRVLQMIFPALRTIRRYATLSKK